MKSKVLVTVTSVPVWRDGEYLIFDRKYYDGTCMYVDLWPGVVRCVMGEIAISEANMPKFGLIKKKKKDLPFDVVIKKYNDPVIKDHLKSSDVVLASGDNFNYLNISKLCNQLGISCFYTIEYIPETRYQITKLETNNWLRLVRRYLYIWNGERRRIKAFDIATGIQANGGAAYEHYRLLSKTAIMYYDTRVTKNMLVTEDLIKDKERGAPLRLAFSGRLEKIKGVDHLLTVCAMLNQREVDFKLSIYGAGSMESEINDYIIRHSLGGKVIMHGPVDFETKLLPALKSEVDVFVCLHRQSDPSCTYLETLSCGVPIVGYLNKSFSFILDEADVGWGAELDDVDQVVEILTGLACNRGGIMRKSFNALEFARKNTFEISFSRRISMLRASVC